MAGDDELVVEVIADDGTVVTADPARRTVEPDPEVTGRPRFRLTPIVVAAVVAVAAAIVAFIVLTDDETDEPLADPIGILDGVAIDAAGATDATFPLFDRGWDVEVVFVDRFERAVRALDLNTGEARTLGSLGPANRRISDIAVVDGMVFLEQDEQIVRVGPDGVEAVTPQASDILSLGQAMLGHYLVESTVFSRSTVLRHLGTGVEIELTAITDFAIAGADVFAAQGGQIVHIDERGEQTRWAAGEMLLAGPTGIAWRACDSPGDCDYWAGTADEPKKRKLIATTAESLISRSGDRWGGGNAFLTLERLSPSLRYATALDYDANGLEVSIVDLQGGERVAVDLRTSVTFAEDERTLFVVAGDELLAIDTASGTVATLVRHDSPSGLLAPVPLLPSN